MLVGEMMEGAKRVQGISTSMIRKMFEMAQKMKGREVISLGLGEPDFDTPKSLCDEAYKAMLEGFTHYTSNFGIPELREKLAEKYTRENGFEVTPENVMVTVGACEALMITALSLFEEGSKIIIPSPSFVGYYGYASLTGCRVVDLITTDEDEFEVNPDTLNEVASKDISFMLVNSPNNPTGAVISEDKVKAIAEIAEDNDIWIISDEVYEKIVYDRPHTSFGKYYDKVITIGAFSKTFAMTGWRVGYVIAREDLIEKMLRVHQYNGVCAPAFAQKAIANVLDTDMAFVGEMVSEFRRRRDLVVKRLNEMNGISCVKPHGAFYVFPRVSGTGMDGEEFAMKLFDDKGVVVVPGGAFGPENEGFIRISYATSYERLERAMNLMEEFVNENKR
jgi:aspartate/methionine/tyrosine aminotransferase